MEECGKCRGGMGDHLLNFRHGTFVLSCPGDMGSIVLGPHYEAAVAALAGRCSEGVAADLWEEFVHEFGAVTLEQKLFRVAGKTHSPGAACSMCPMGWPVPCVDHGGGCEGSIHGTLRDVRKDRTYSGNRLPDRGAVLFAYGNAGRRGDYGDLVLSACCDTCASPSGPRERSEAKRRLAAGSADQPRTA